MLPKKTYLCGLVHAILMRLRFAIRTVLATLIVIIIPCRALTSVTDSTLIASRLADIETPISLPYNNELENSIRKQEAKAVPHDILQNANTIANIIEEFGMPVEFKFLPACLKTGDNSRCGDWALTPIVAIRYGLTITARHDERFATEASTCAALRYLTDLYNYYGDWWKSIMAFAYSPATVNNFCSKNETSNPWDFGSLDKAHIVRNFITYVYLYNDKELTPKEEEYLEVEFREPINFNTLAEKLKIDNNKVIELNPIFIGEVIYPLKDYQLRLPAERAEYFYEIEEEIYKTIDSTTLAKKEDATINLVTENTKKSSISSAKPLKYKVKKGDTLGKIAIKHGISVEKLKKMNNLRSDLIREGQLLIVRYANGAQSANSKTQVSQEKGSKTIYIIKKGDTLSTIAQRYKVKVSDLKIWNNLKSDAIQEGDKLMIHNQLH